MCQGGAAAFVLLLMAVEALALQLQRLWCLPHSFMGMGFAVADAHAVVQS